MHSKLALLDNNDDKQSCLPKMITFIILAIQIVELQVQAENR